MRICFICWAANGIMISSHIIQLPSHCILTYWIRLAEKMKVLWGFDLKKMGQELMTQSMIWGFCHCWILAINLKYPSHVNGLWWWGDQGNCYAKVSFCCWNVTCFYCIDYFVKPFINTFSQGKKISCLCVVILLFIYYWHCSYLHSIALMRMWFYMTMSAPWV